MHYTCDKYTLTKQMITAGIYISLSVVCMKRVFAALQLLQMIQQPNRYEGRGNRAKAHRPERGDEPAKKCTKQAAKEKAKPSSAGRRGSKAPSSSAHQPKAQASKAGRPRKGTTKAARTRRQQTGKKGARKKAEINESEPSGTNSELSNVDYLESYSSQVQPLAHVCGACS